MPQPDFSDAIQMKNRLGITGSTFDSNCLFNMLSKSNLNDSKDYE